MRLLLVFILFPLFIYYPTCSQDWEQCEGVNGANIGIIGAKGNMLLAVSTYNATMFRSYNNGDTWERLQDLENGERYVWEIYAICSNDKEIFVGTDLGVFRTDDDGNSWEFLGLENFKIESIVIKNEVLLCTTSYGYVFRSRDNGNTWSKIYEYAPNSGGKIIFNDNTLYIVNSELHQSTDNGISWHIIDDSVIKSNQNGFLTQSIACSNGNVYVGTVGALYKSTDDGLTWINLIDVYTPPSWEHNTWVRSIYAVGDTVYVLTHNDALRSYNGGEKWYYVPIDEVPNTFLQHNSTLFAGSYAGFSKSEDNGFTWEEKNKGLNYVSIYSLIETEEVLLAGSDLGISRSTDNGRNWNYVKKGDEREYGNNFLKNKVYTFAMDTRSMKRSKDKGISWEEFGPFKSDDFSESNIIRSATIQNEKLFITTKDRDTLYVSEDNSNVWKKIALTMNLYILASDNKYIYAVTTSQPQKLIRTKDGGENWEDFSIKKVTNYSALVVANDVMFAIASNLLLRSTNDGGSWEDIGKEYELVNPRTIAYSNGILYAATNKGIFVSKDKGSTCEMYYFEYPATCILPVQDNLFVGTIEFSLWKHPFEISSLGEENTARDNVLNIHPNPVSNKFTVKLNNFNEIAVVNIYNVYGQLVLNQKLENQEAEIDVSTMPVGEYNIVLNVGNNISTDKIVIMK